MTVPERPLLLASAFLLLAGSAANAQTHANKIRRVTEPLIQADLDLTTGKYTIGSRVRKKAAIFNTSRSLSNVDFSGFVGIDSVQCEWFDGAVKGLPPYGTGGKSEIMTSFLFAYCSSALATTSGGVGGSATVSFVEGYVEGPPVGTPRPSFASRTAVYNLSGLPANTASSSFFGGFNCFFLRVFTAVPQPNPFCSFDGGQPLADGIIGWSWDFRDLSLLAPLAHTFPFLACVQSCSGVGPSGLGMTDGVDQYCGAFPNNPPFTLLSSFTFGTTTTFTSLNIEIREANKIIGASSLYNPSGPGDDPDGINPVILTNTNAAGMPAEPILGGGGFNTLDCTGHAPKAAILRYEFKPGTVVPFAIAAANGNVLVSLVASDGRNLVIPNHGGGKVTVPLPIPIDLQFLDVAYQVQGFCGDSPKGQLSNALNQLVGSHQP